VPLRARTNNCGVFHGGHYDGHKMMVTIRVRSIIVFIDIETVEAEQVCLQSITYYSGSHQVWYMLSFTADTKVLCSAGH
jgi:hypothetical protein